MLRLALAAVLGIGGTGPLLAQQEIPVDLPEPEVHAIQLDGSDPILEDLGPHGTIEYTASEEGVLFVFATSEELDPVLQVADDEGFVFAENDDCDAGTAAWLRLGVDEGEVLRLIVAAKSTAASGPVVLRIVSMVDTEETWAAAAAAGDALAVVASLATSGDLDAARARLGEIIEELLSTPGAARSQAILDRLDVLDARAVSLSEQQALFRCRTFSLAILERTHPDGHPNLRRAREELGFSLDQVGRSREALALRERAHRTASRLLPEDHPDLQRAREAMANQFDALGEYETAAELYERVLDVQSRVLSRESPYLQRIRFNYASTLSNRGELAAARAIQEEAVDVLSRTVEDDHRYLQFARGALATTLDRLGVRHATRALWEKVLEVRARTQPEDHPELQNARNNLAATLWHLGDFAGARELFEKVLDVRSRTFPEEDLEVQFARMNLASALRPLGELDSALDLAEQAHDLVRRQFPADHYDVCKARTILAMILLDLGELAAARELFQTGVESLARTRSDDSDILQEERERLIQTLLRMGDAPAAQRAVADLCRGTRVGLSRRLWILSPREIDRFVASQAVPELALALSVGQGAGVLPRTSRFDAECFSLIESVRAVGSMRASLSRVAARDPRTRDLREAIRRAARDVTLEARRGTVDRDAYLLAVRRKDAADRALQEHLAQRPDGAGIVPAIDADEIAAALPEAEAAVSFWRHDQLLVDPVERIGKPSVPGYVAFVVRNGVALQRVELGPAAPIDRAVIAWRSAIGAPVERGAAVEAVEDDPVVLGETVRQHLIDPLLPALDGIRRVHLALAEGLHQIPFDALPIDHGVLGDSLEVVRWSALASLTIESGDVVHPPSLFAMGGVNYDQPPDSMEEPEDRQGHRDESTLADHRGAPTHVSRGSGETLTWNRLPFSAEEAALVAEYFGDAFEDGGEVVSLRRRAASRAAFERHAPDHRFLHLATHGYFAPQSIPSIRDERTQTGADSFSSAADQVRGFSPGVLCGIVFAGANVEVNEYGQRTGVMTAEELSVMDLSGCELAVLSACETGVGLLRGGQSLASLQQALHAAGVRTTITSLWSVPDEATRLLMGEFYRRIWLKKEPKAQALWAAKRRLREELDARGQPVHTERDWAGWVLTGHPD